MMDKLVLQAKTRKVFAKQLASLRKGGELPAIVYGHGLKEAQPITLTATDAQKAYANAGSNQMVGLKLDDARAKNVLFQAVQHDPRTGDLMHVDLYAVRMDEKIRTEVPLHFVGESIAVYQQEGTLLKNLDAIEVEALPGDLPQAFEVDISILDDFEKSIHVADLVVPAGVTVLVDPEELITKVEPPRSEAELEELDVAPVAELPEGAEEGEATVAAEGEAEGATETEPNKQAEPKPQ